jgi:predicted component of type VI protein secretion system
MDDQELHNLLEQLHSEIERSDTVDEEERELLQHLAADIRRLLDRSEGEVNPSETSMIKRVEESIDQYEITHPDLTMLLSKLLTILSNAGI